MNDQVNIFFLIMSERSHCFLCNEPLLSGSKVSSSRTHHGGGRYQARPLVSESDALPLSHRTVGIIRSLRKVKAALYFLLKVDGRVFMIKKRYLIVYKNCQARCMHPLGQSEFLDIDIHPIHIFKKGRSLSVTGERMWTEFLVAALLV